MVDFGKLDKREKIVEYQITFTGRKVGAIGLGSTWHEKVTAENLKAATLKLYDTHEHIRVRSVLTKAPAKNGCEGCTMYSGGRKHPCMNGNPDQLERCRASDTIFVKHA